MRLAGSYCIFAANIVENEREMIALQEKEVRITDAELKRRLRHIRRPFIHSYMQGNGGVGSRDTRLARWQ